MYQQTMPVEGSTKCNILPFSNVWVYDIHDENMIYYLLQHSLWNPKHLSFFCANTQTAGLEDEVCKFETFHDLSYAKLYEQSVWYWDDEVKCYNKYNNYKHINWRDKSKYGATHLGFLLDSLYLLTICFNPFNC